MSYSICYAMQAWHYPITALVSDAKAWFEQQGLSVTDAFHSDVKKHLGLILPRTDTFVFTGEFGESNLFDDDGKRVRDEWSCHGFLTASDAVRYLGIRWSEDVESGSLKPNGRWSTAESWIKRIKQQLKQAEPLSRCPRRCEKSFYSMPPLDALSESQILLMQTLTRMSVEPITGLYGDEQAFRLVCHPKSAFEWWLFCQAVHHLPEHPPALPMTSMDW